MNDHAHGYYYRTPAQFDPYYTGNRKNYNKNEWNNSATICSKMMQANRNQVVRDTSLPTSFETSIPKALLRSTSSESFINFMNWKNYDNVQVNDHLKQSFDKFAGEDGKVLVKDVPKLVRDCLGEDTPAFVIDKYCVIAWKVSYCGKIAWNDFSNHVPAILKAIEADCVCKREAPPLVKLMNKPRNHDKALGQYNISSTIYMDTYNFNAAEAQRELFSTVNMNATCPLPGNVTNEPLKCEVKGTRRMALNPATKLLSSGTSKNTQQLPGYLGHIPYNVRNDKKREHSDGRYVHPVINDLMLTQKGMGCILGYAGYVPLPSLNVKFNERRTGTDPLTTTGAAFGADRRML